MSDQHPPPPPGPYPPQGGQPYPPQGGQPYFGQPPKKSHLVRNILIGVIVFFILMCGGCFALVGVGANEAAKDADNDLKSSDVAPADDKSDAAKSDDEKSEEPKADDKKEEPKEEPKADIGSKDNPAPRGKAVQNKSAKYQIDNVEVKDSLGSFTDPPGGKYVVVTITVQNVKDETIQVSSEDFRLQVGGTEIDTSDQAYILDNAFSYDDLSPGLKRTGVIVFDVAPKDAGKGVIRAQALMSLDEEIYLKVAK